MARLRFGPDAAAVALDNLFANGQADAGAGIFFLGMQALEDLKDAVGILRIKADAVIPDETSHSSPFLPGRKMNPGGLVVVKLDGVGDEILQQLAHLVRIDFQGRQGVVADFGAVFPNQGVQVVQGPFEDIF